jgi:hypothetical protein
VAKKPRIAAPAQFWDGSSVHVAPKGYGTASSASRHGERLNASDSESRIPVTARCVSGTSSSVATICGAARSAPSAPPPASDAKAPRRAARGTSRPIHSAPAASAAATETASPESSISP